MLTTPFEVLISWRAKCGNLVYDSFFAKVVGVVLTTDNCATMEIAYAVYERSMMIGVVQRTDTNIRRRLHSGPVQAGGDDGEAR
jgi:hypothetical protein